MIRRVVIASLAATFVMGGIALAGPASAVWADECAKESATYAAFKKCVIDKEAAAAKRRGDNEYDGPN